MPYREQWVLDILSGRSVLDLALCVHMATTGSAECSPIDREKDVLALREIEHTWDNRYCCDFDECVLALVRAAIHEAGYATVKETYGDGNE